MIILYIHSRIDRQNKTYKWNNVQCYWKLDGIFPTPILRKFMHDFVKLLIVLLRFFIVTLLYTIPIVVNR